MRRKKWIRPQARTFTPQEIEDGMKTWARRGRHGVSAVADRVGYRRLPSVGRTLLILGLGMSLLLVLGLTATGQAKHERIVSDHEQQTQELRGQVEEGDEESGRPSRGEAKAMTSVRNQAQQAAKAVAGGQNAFPDLLVDRLEAMSGSGKVEEKPLRAVVDQRRALARYFTSDSYVLDNDRVYAWTTAASGYDGVEMADDEIDPRLPWYLPEETFAGATGSPEASGSARSGKAAKAAATRKKEARQVQDRTTCRWEVTSVVPRLDERKIVDVVWLCRNAGGATLAWATATYDGQEGTFADLDLAVARGDQGVDQQAGEDR